MAIHILFGPGGSGKSFFQARLIVRELVTTNRYVSTNLSLQLPRLQQYIEETYPEAKVDVTARVRLLTEEETREFWRYRSPKHVNEHEKLVEGGEWRITPGPGTMFVIDEAGVAGFDATGWASGLGDSKGTRGQFASWYLDQQRKMGDDVWASCNGRRPGGIAKPFRDKAHAFIRLKNGYLSSWGMFKGQGRFTARWYQVEPLSKDVEHFREDVWTMDAAGIGSVYRTQDGVGVMGATADIGKRAKGIPIVWAIPGAIAIAAVCLIAVPKIMGSYVSKSKDKAVETVTEPEKKKAAQTLPQKAESEKPTVFVRGVVHKGREVIATLTDGRILTEFNTQYLRLTRAGIESPRGTHYPFLTIEPRPPQPQPPPEPRPTVAESRPAPQPEYKGEQLFDRTSTYDSLVKVGETPSAASVTRRR